jgi:predicted GIY-YIG superfamily endonuclease
MYVLLCWDGSYYVGVTSDLPARIAQHESGEYLACFTRIRRPVLLLYSEAFDRVDDAIAAEKRLKGWSRAKKRALIEGRCGDLPRLSRSRRVEAKGEIVAHPSTGSG